MNCQAHLYQRAEPAAVARRWFLQQCGVGLGAVALGNLLSECAACETSRPAGTNPLAPQQPHYAPKAKNVIYLFMGGAPSHLELLDYKPQLAKFDGKLPPADLIKDYRAAFINPNSQLLGPRFQFARHGRSGAELSELLPHLAGVADDITIVKSMVTDAFNHAPAQILMHTGRQQFGRPSIGSWVTYGVGSESSNLPAFVVVSSGKKGPSGGNSNWGSGFLPSVYQGVPFRGGKEPVLYLSNPPGVDEKLQRDSLDVLGRLNQRRLDIVGDPEIATRINSYEMAFRMQTSAPEVMDLNREPKHVLEMYGAEPGKPSFANNCLLARRLVENGVSLITSSFFGIEKGMSSNWDDHAVNWDCFKAMKERAPVFDQAVAALIEENYGHQLALALAVGGVAGVGGHTHMAAAAAGARLSQALFTAGRGWIAVVPAVEAGEAAAVVADRSARRTIAAQVAARTTVVDVRSEVDAKQAAPG